jgi:molybdate transport system substrate-binding protein
MGGSKKWYGAVMAVGILAAACGSNGSNGSAGLAATTSTGEPGRATGDIAVLATSSLTNAFSAERAAFEKVNPKAKVTLSFGATATVVEQVQAKAPADVIVTSDTTSIATLTSKRLIGRATTIARNRLEILVPAGNPAKITKIADLSKPGVKLDMCSDVVPCGKSAAAVLASAKLRVKPESTEDNTEAVVAKVMSGAANAGIVYTSDALAAGAHARGINIPSAQNAIATYPAAVVKGSKHAKASEAFIAFVASPAGQKVLKTSGFMPPV